MKISLSFLISIVLATGFCKAQDFGDAKIVDKIIAKVDDEILLKSELEEAYRGYLQSGQFKTPQLKCKVLETLIINKLLVAKAEIDSVMVDDKQVESQLDRRMAVILDRFGGDEKTVEEKYGKTIEELKDELAPSIRDQMIVQKMQQTITSHIKVTPSDVRKFYKEIPEDSLPLLSEQIIVGQIMMYPEVSKAQKQRTIDKLQTIKEEIESGADFATMAKEFSDDRGSARQGGDLGWQKRGTLVPQFEEAVFNLDKGEISDVVESPFGMHLIQLIERRGQEFHSRHILLEVDYSSGDVKLTKTKLEVLRREILGGEISFEKAAKEYSDDMETKTNGGYFLDQQSGSQKISMEDLDPDIFFIVDTMEVGNITPPIKYRTADGKEALRIVYYQSKIPPHVANLKEDYQRIADAALQEKKTVALNEWFENTKGEVYIDVDDDYNMCNILNIE